MVMSRTSKKFLQIILPIGIILAAALGFVQHNFSFSQTQTRNGASEQNVSRLSLYRIPNSLSFCGEPMPLEIPDVRERMEQAFYTELSDAQIILDLKRSTKYFPFVEQKLRDMNLPEDLKYLAVAESALRNLVSSKDAAGIWQFTQDTARHYGLIVNEFVDERFNFHKSTEAALRYLNDLHSSFGSWALAAAAYNMGSGGVKASLDYQMVRNYYSLYLNDETARFVFRIVALKQIMEHYRKYGFDLRPADFYQATETKLIVVTQIPELATWARQQGSSYKELKYLNPWLINRSLPTGTWAIELPKYAQPVEFTSSTPIMSDTLQEVNSVQAEKRNFVYVVKRGDSLDRIALKFRISVKDLVDWNNLRGRRYLKAGEKLKIFLDNQNLEQ